MHISHNSRCRLGNCEDMSITSGNECIATVTLDPSALTEVVLLNMDSLIPLDRAMETPIYLLTDNAEVS